MEEHRHEWEKEEEEKWMVQECTHFLPLWWSVNHKRSAVWMVVMMAQSAEE